MVTYGAPEKPRRGFVAGYIIATLIGGVIGSLASFSGDLTKVGKKALAGISNTAIVQQVKTENNLLRTHIAKIQDTLSNVTTTPEFAKEVESSLYSFNENVIRAERQFEAGISALNNGDLGKGRDLLKSCASSLGDAKTKIESAASNGLPKEISSELAKAAQEMIGLVESFLKSGQLKLAVKTKF